jgi:hypothetical protein
VDKRDENLVGSLQPELGLGVRVPQSDPLTDVLFGHRRAGVGTLRDLLLGELTEPSLDDVHQRARAGSEVQMTSRVAEEPASMSGVVWVEQLSRIRYAPRWWHLVVDLDEEVL